MVRNVRSTLSLRVSRCAIGKRVTRSFEGRDVRLRCQQRPSDQVGLFRAGWSHKGIINSPCALDLLKQSAVCSEQRLLCFVVEVIIATFVTVNWSRWDKQLLWRNYLQHNRRK